MYVSVHAMFDMSTLSTFYSMCDTVRGPFIMP